MNTAHLEFHQGCPAEFWCSDWSSLNFSVVNIGNKLYARCDETHDIISSEPKTKLLYNIIRVYWLKHFTAKGYSPQDCNIPKTEYKKEAYRIGRMNRTLAMKAILIKAGVLKK